MRIDCKTEFFPKHRESWVAYLSLGALALLFWADAASATAGSSTGGSSSTGSTGIAGGVSTDAAAYLFAPMVASLLGAWLSLRQRVEGWMKGFLTARKCLGIFYFSTLAYGFSDIQGTLLWVGIALVQLRATKSALVDGLPRVSKSESWWKYTPELWMALAWLSAQSALPALSLLVAPLWLLGWEKRDTQMRERLPLVAASFVLFLLGMREWLDPILARGMAQASGWFLAGTGASIHLDGATILGLRVPIHVTAACAGTVVTLTPFALGALLSALGRAPLRVQWQAALGLGCAAALVNLARIVGVALSSVWWDAEQMQLFHDVIGWPMAAMLYAAFALWLREAMRPPASP